MLSLLFDLLNLPSPVESPDPVLDVLAVDPGAVIGRRYAGYCLFLFGAADEDLATWFARNLVALDSLTGSNIACLVLAARVKVRVEGKSLEERRRRLAQRNEEIPRELKISDIKATKSVDRMVSNGIPLWTGTTREITAVTYGTDAFASRLGVTHLLPCLVVLDAFPSDSYEILRLNDPHVTGLVPLLREVIQKFNGRENFTFFERLSATEKIQSRITSLQNEVGRAEEKLAALRFKDPSVGVVRHRNDLRQSLIEGNTPEFERLLWSSFVTENERSVGHLAAMRLWGQLRRNSKTLNNLMYFSGQPIWPLQDNWLQRTSIIYEKYAQDYRPERKSSLRPESRDYCVATINQIQQAQESMASEVTRSWREAETVRLHHKESFDCERSGIEETADKLRKELRAANEEFESSLQVMLSQRYPSLKDVFREIARKKKMQTARNTVGEALVKMSSSLLKPETLIKIVEALK